MPLRERFKLTAEQVDPEYRANCVKNTESLLNRVDLMPWKHQMLGTDASMTAVAYYLMDRRAEARQYAERVMPAVVDYFFGDWRNTVNSGNYHDSPPDPAWWYDKESWMNPFGAALCWGSVLGEWKSLRKVAAYPDDRRSMEKSGIDKKPALRQLLLDIASHLRGEKVVNSAARVGKLVGANWRGTTVQAEALDAIASKDEDAANDALNRFLGLHHKRKRSKDITDTVSMDATFMVKLARHEGLGMQIDPKFEMYIIEL